MQLTSIPLGIRNRLESFASSIAFYPLLFCVGSLFLAILILRLEDWGVTTYLAENARYLLIYNANTARTVLGTLIGGMISLTVFSFTMVMTILNQAASQLSPRLLPGLISNRRHQLVLGAYLGSIIYCTVVLINVLPGQSDATPSQGFAALVGIVYVLTCLALFIYFINSISNEVQVGYVVRHVRNDALKQMDEIIENQVDKQEKDLDFDDWQQVKTDTVGYLHHIDEQELISFANEHDTVLFIEPVLGTFITEDSDFVRSKRELDVEEKEQLCRLFDFNSVGDVERNYEYAFQQITEVAVKAMSPGINDPGTAITSINYLFELIEKRMLLADYFYLSNEQDDPDDDAETDDSETEAEHSRLIVQRTDFADILYPIMASLRTYAKHDVNVVLQLANKLKNLLHAKTYNDDFAQSIKTELRALAADSLAAIDNDYDRRRLKKVFKDYDEEPNEN